MVSRKYLRDYKLSESVSPSGRIVTESVYVGGDYYLTAPEEELRRALPLMWAAAAAACAAFICALIPLSRASRLMWVMLPHAFAALPLYYLVRNLLYFRALPGPYTHRRADTLQSSFPPACAFLAGLSAAALAGFIVAALAWQQPLLPGDLVFALCDGVMAAAGGLLFSRRRLARSAKREETA